MSSGTHYRVDRRIPLKQLRLQQLLEELQYISEKIGAGQHTEDLRARRYALTAEVHRRNIVKDELIFATRARAAAYQVRFEKCIVELRQMVMRLQRVTDIVEEQQSIIGELNTEEVTPVRL